SPVESLPALDIDWSTENPGGVAFYQSVPTLHIVLPGEAGVDTDEYDEHVIAHEFGHYVEDSFSRSDSIGGPHGGGDLLDMRVAFGEGYGYAFGAIALNNPVTRDSFGLGQTSDGNFNVEGNTWARPGWFSEASNWSILWDLFDAANDGPDTVALGFASLWAVLTDEQRSAEAFTGIFPFITALKQRNPAQAAQIDQIVSSQDIVAASVDAYGATESNAGGAATSADVLPVYTTVQLDGAAQTVQSVGTVQGITGDGGNKLSNHRYLRLNISMQRNVRFRVSAPAGRDADIFIVRQGSIIDVGRAPANEDFTVLNMPAGNYVLNVHDCENAECSDAPSYDKQPTPITVQVTSN
ncbi:MAG TPA: hypothetical protein VJ011_00145, partial [Steroidobacteraceae bacterium]|nr:hypothetical protein [Steroidobacteraceae bacterium]